MRKILILLFFFSNISIIQATGLNKATAMEMLSSEGITKIQTHDLNSLLDKDVQEFIVVFKQGKLSKRKMKGLDQHQQMAQSSVSSKDSMLFDANSMDITIMKDYSMLPMMAIKSSNKQAFVEIINRQDVVAVYENKKRSTNLQQSLPLINQPQVDTLGHLGDNTSIAILDTGVDYTQAIFGCTSPNTPAGCRVSFARDFAPEDGELDAVGHGTNVAAIAASVAPGAKILALDVFPDGNAFDDTIIEAINWSIQNKFEHNIVSMNLSLGDGSQHNTVCESSYTTPIANARKVGIIPVFSTGNSAFVSGIGSPACTAGAVRVGAVYDADIGRRSWESCIDETTETDQVACFSNSGDLLTLLAPGALITAGGEIFGGTSQASPHVAGAVAVLRADDVAPNDSLEQTISHLTNSGVLITDPRNDLQRRRLNLLAAVNDALSSSPPPTTSIEDACELGNFADGSLIAGEAVCIPDFSNGGQFQSEIFVPNDKVGSTMEIILSHGSGNGNLLHRHNNRPTSTVFDHLSDNAGNEERILVENVQELWNYIHVRADPEFSDVTILVRYVEDSTPPIEPSPTTPDIEIVDACQEGQTPVGNVELFAGDAVCLQDISNSGQRQMALFVTDDKVGSTLEILISHGTGNGDLLHKYDSRPNGTVFDHISSNSGNEERILVDNVQLGWNYIHVRADTAFSDVTLLARYME